MPAPVIGLGSPFQHTPWSVFQNVRRNTGSPRFLLLVCTRVVSVEPFVLRRSITSRFQALFHLPSEGTLQRSLTLLVRYRSRGVFSLPSQCLGSSRGISNPRYSGTGARRTGLRYGTVTLYRAPFQGTSRRRSDDGSQPNTPHCPKASVWAVSRSLAVTDDIAVAFCSCRY